MVYRLNLTQVEELVTALVNLSDPQRAELDLFALFILRKFVYNGIYEVWVPFLIVTRHKAIIAVLAPRSMYGVLWHAGFVRGLGSAAAMYISAEPKAASFAIKLEVRLVSKILTVNIAVDVTANFTYILELLLYLFEDLFANVC